MAFVVVENACVTYLPFTDPKNLSYIYVKRTLSRRINCTTKGILLNTFLMSAIRFHAFKQEPREVGIFLGCLLFGILEVSRLGIINNICKIL